MQSESTTSQYSPLTTHTQIITWPVTYSAVTNTASANTEVTTISNTANLNYLLRKSYSDIYFNYLSELLGSKIEPEISNI